MGAHEPHSPARRVKGDPISAINWNSIPDDKDLEVWGA